MNDFLILLSLSLFALAVALIRIGGGTRILRSVFGFSGFLLVLASGFFIVSDYFTGNGIDESVVYHLRYGLRGAGYREYIGISILASASILLSLATFIITFRLIRPLKEQRRNPRKWLVCTFLLLAVLSHPACLGMLNSTILAGGVEVPFVKKYKKPRVLTKPSHAKNLVYIYAESLERTYFDEDLFPGLVTGLKELESKGLSFTNVDQVYGSGWTIGGMVASRCGLPLVTASGMNSMSGVDKFLPGATCMGDILHSNGYRLVYMAGADLDFGGKGKFYGTHGFAEILGREELAPTLDDITYQSGWGLYDDSLLDRVYQRFEELSETGEPFGLFTLTLDTHHPEGHPSGRCAGLAYQDGSNPILNAVRCSDLLITEFVNRVMASPYARNTMVVISSDHLAMHNTAWKQLSRGRRRNMLIVIDPDTIQPASIDKPASVLDIAPTILSLLGYETPALGLGRNLMSDMKTLVDDVGDTEEILRGWSSEIAGLWEYPKVNSGILVDVRRSHLRLGDRVMKLPVLLSLTEEGGIREAFFDFYSERKLSSYVIDRAVDETLLWVDACEEIDAFQSGGDKAPFCIFLGKTGDSNAIIAGVDDELYIPQEQLLGVLKHPSSLSVVEARRERLTNALKIDQRASLAFLPSKGAFGKIRIRSQGCYAKGESYLQTSNSRLPLSRGVTLLGIVDSSTLVSLANVDTCTDLNQSAAMEPFRQTMARYSKSFSVFAIVVHDSMFCEPTDFSIVFEGLGLKKLDGLRLRQPYIAIVAADLSRNFEIDGGAEGSIELLLTKFYRK